MKKKPKDVKTQRQVNLTKKIIDANRIPFEKVNVFNERSNLLYYYTFPHVIEQTICYTNRNQICLSSKKTKYNLKDQLESNKVYDDEKPQIIETVVDTVIELEKIGICNSNVKTSNVLFSTKNKIYLVDYLNCDLLSLNNTEKMGKIMLGLFILTTLENNIESFSNNSIYNYVKLPDVKYVKLKDENNKVYESIINKLLNYEMIYEEVKLEINSNNNNNNNDIRLSELLKYNNYYFNCHHLLNKRTSINNYIYIK